MSDASTVISLDEEENVYRYEPIETSDVRIVVTLVDRESKPTGTYIFHVHKAVLASQCEYFAGLFTVDKKCTEVVMPESFVSVQCGGRLRVITLPLLLLLFNTLYNIEKKCWWALSDSDRGKLIQSDMAVNPIFYVGHKTLLNAIEIFCVTTYEKELKVTVNIFGLYEAMYFKMTILEEHILKRLEDKLRTERITEYSRLIGKHENVHHLIPASHWNRLLKAACSV